MMPPRSGPARNWTATLLCLWAVTPVGAQTVIEHVRLFDGERVIEGATVVFDESILSVGTEDASVPTGATVLDGTGHTLMPGLIDSHTHTWGTALEQALNYGVTTVLDMFTDHAWAASMHAEQVAGKANARADLFSAGTLVTAEGGHGTQFGIPIPTLDRAEDAADFVAARIAEGSDYLKLIYEDGATVGRPLPTLDRATLEAAIEAAHDQGKLAVVHVSTLEKAHEALAGGADGLVHVFYDRGIDDRFAELAAQRHLFVVPTLTVVESVMGGGAGKALLEDPGLAPFLAPDQRGGLGQSFPSREATSFEQVLTTVQSLREAGVAILTGSDAPNPGTAFGISVHRELELLVEAGLEPVDALAAATSAPADAFRLADRGRVTPGAKADLVLVKGNPTEDILATRELVGIWKDGVRHERREYGQADTNPTFAGGLISGFDDGTQSSERGSGWNASTDQMAGGKSVLELEARSPGANGSASALSVSGEIREGFPFPWSGPMFLPGATPMAPTDASTAQRVVFWARAPEPRPIRVMVFAESLGMRPAETSVDVGTDWQRFEVPFDRFGGFEPQGFQGLLFSGGPGRGPFAFDIDEVSLEP